VTDQQSNPDIFTNTQRSNCPELEEARRFGIDVTMLVDNLNRTVEERIRRHQIAANLAKELRSATILQP